MKYLVAAFLPLSLLITACDSESDVAREAGSSEEAEGEVLGGSISDDMLPLGELKSQSPPLRESGDAAAGSGNTPDDAEAGETGEEGGEPAGEPAPEAPAEPAPPPAEEG